MSDNHTPDERSYNMSRIRSKNTKPEEKVRKYLFAKGFRYKKNDHKLSGCPDIVLPKYRTVIFVQGCFWHMHNCGKFRWPTSNQEYWKKKIICNVERDKKVQAQLKDVGWNVLVVWECELKKAVFDKTMKALVTNIIN